MERFGFIEKNFSVEYSGVDNHSRLWFYDFILILFSILVYSNIVFWSDMNTWMCLCFHSAEWMGNNYHICHICPIKCTYSPARSFLTSVCSAECAASTVSVLTIWIMEATVDVLTLEWTLSSGVHMGKAWLMTWSIGVALKLCSYSLNTYPSSSAIPLSHCKVSWLFLHLVPVFVPTIAFITTWRHFVCMSSTTH